MSERTLPDIGAVLAPLLERVAPDERALLIAIAERMAAERYRTWAAQVDDPNVRAGLLACAAREDEIASRVEALYPDAPAAQARVRAALPELPTVNAALFAGRPLAEQFAIQATGERLGAATWRALAAFRTDAVGRGALLGCAPLEEASAQFLESLRT